MTLRHAFTLIELLIVVSIIGLLSGMLMPVVTAAQHRSKKTNTLALLGKVESALELFRGEMDTYPYQAHDVLAVFPAADNQLAWTLGHDQSLAERTDLDTNLQLARAAYGTNGLHRLGRTPAPNDIDPTYAPTSGTNMASQFNLEQIQYQEMALGVVNRMAMERATLAVIAGNADITGIRADRTKKILSTPTRGFARNYLSFDLNPRNIRGDAVIDTYGHELIYVCPFIQGMRSVYAPECSVKNIWNSTPGKPIDVGYYELTPKGRVPTTSLDSDIRTSANLPYALGFELWSAGPDGRIDPIRRQSANRDNIAARDYHRGLQ